MKRGYLILRLFSGKISCYFTHKFRLNWNPPFTPYFFNITYLFCFFTIIIIIIVIALLGIDFEDLHSRSRILFSLWRFHRFPVNLFVEYEKVLARESDALAFLLNTDGDLRRDVTI